MTVLPTNAELLALIAKLQADNAKLKASTDRKLSFKVTAKRIDDKTGKEVGSDGAISVYGLGRFPVTLYAASWERLLAAAPELTAFIAANEAVISRK
jgi:hypothetical protein